MGEVEYVDIAKAYDGGICPVCGRKSIYTSRGIEVGNIFQLGTKYTESDEHDLCRRGRHRSRTRSWAATASAWAVWPPRVCEAHRDDYGPIWPISHRALARADLLAARGSTPRSREMSQKIYDELTKRGVEVLWDDRPVSAGVMFSDADLFGVPVRVVVSPKGLEERHDRNLDTRQIHEREKGNRRSGRFRIRLRCQRAGKAGLQAVKANMRPVSPGAFFERRENMDYRIATPADREDAIDFANYVFSPGAPTARFQEAAPEGIRRPCARRSGSLSRLP